jgi:hypothetical protein
LKLPYAGYRSSIVGSMSDQGIRGLYWSSSPHGRDNYDLGFSITAISSNDLGRRMYGFSVRCFKN